MQTNDEEMTLYQLTQKYRNDPHLVLYLLLLAYVDDLPQPRLRVSMAFEVIRDAWISHYGPLLAH